MGLAIARVSNWSYKCARFNEMMEVMRDDNSIRGTPLPLLERWKNWLSWSEFCETHEQTHACLSFRQSIKNARIMKVIRPVFCSLEYCILLQIYRDSYQRWAAITLSVNSLAANCVCAGGVCQNYKLWAVDHSARVSRKSKANFVIYCELQNALIINLSNAHCGYWLTVAPFVWGSVVSTIVTFVSDGLWGVMILVLRELCLAPH